MAKKQSKRTRKFNSSGGVQARLQRGSINCKGSLKRKHGQRSNSIKRKHTDDGEESEKSKNRDRDIQSPTSYTDKKRQRRGDADFVSQKNLADLDIESFFESFSEEQPMTEEGGHNDRISEGESGKNIEDTSKEGRRPETKDTNAQTDGILNIYGDSSSGSASNSDSDSEDENIDDAERRMKEEMGNLQENDPEFHQFLKDNEEGLLDYGVDEGTDDDDHPGRPGHVDDLDQTNGSKRGDVIEKTEKSFASTVVMTPRHLDKFEKGAFKSHGIKALKNLVNAFKVACHLADEDGGTTAKGERYKIESSDVFDSLMVLCLSKCHDEFYFHLFKETDELKGKESDETDVGHNVFDPNKPISPKLLERADKWEGLRPIISTFLKSMMHILSEAKQPDLIVFVLKALTNYIPYATPFPRIAENMLKILTGLWSAPIDSSDDYQVVRLHSFLRIRQLALTQPFPFIEACLKKLYLAYAQRAKFATGSSVSSALPTLTFMGNCVVELYSLDYHSSYQHAFVYIRQLALHLRAAMQKKTADATGAVYCWQFLHCLKLWVAVLTEACQTPDDSERINTFSNSGEEQLLQSLIFPLSQIIFGTARLIPSTRYLPLRLHCVRLLQQLAAAAGMFLPTTSILLNVFELSEFYQPPKKVGKGKAQQPMPLILRLRADSPLQNMEEMESCLSEVFVLLNREIELYRFSAGFPEFSVRVHQRLKKFSKDTRNSRWRAYAKGCLDLCHRYSSWAMNERTNPNSKNSLLNDVAPKEIRQLEVLKPNSIPSMGRRHSESLEKEKQLEVFNRPVQKAKISENNSNEVANDADHDSRRIQNRSFDQKRKVAKKRKRNTEHVGASKHLEGNHLEDSLEQEDKLQDGIDWSDDE